MATIKQAINEAVERGISNISFASPPPSPATVIVPHPTLEHLVEDT